MFDVGGAVVQRAKVVIKNEAQEDERDVITTADGDFFVPLNPANYDVAVRAQGFKSLASRGVRVQITDQDIR